MSICFFPVYMSLLLWTFQVDFQGGGKHCIFLEFLSSLSFFKKRKGVAEGNYLQFSKPPIWKS